MTTYMVKNWQRFQHYKHRNPPWIKLHFEMLSSEDWVMLDDAGRVLAIACMLVASRTGGVIDSGHKGLSYLRRVAYLNSEPDLKPLIECGFLALQADASTMLADASTLQADASRPDLNKTTLQANRPSEAETELEEEAEEETEKRKAGGRPFESANNEPPDDEYLATLDQLRSRLMRRDNKRAARLDPVIRTVLTRSGEYRGLPIRAVRHGLVTALEHLSTNGDVQHWDRYIRHVVLAEAQNVAAEARQEQEARTKAEAANDGDALAKLGVNVANIGR